jgi:hypothetical protein
MCADTPIDFSRVRESLLPWPQSNDFGHLSYRKISAVRGWRAIIARLTYRQRYAQSTGRDPLICPHCRGEMEVWRIWHPTYGVIYDEGEVIKRGTYASTVQRAGPGGKG